MIGLWKKIEDIAKMFNVRIGYAKFDGCKNYYSMVNYWWGKHILVYPCCQSAWVEKDRLLDEGQHTTRRSTYSSVGIYPIPAGACPAHLF